ncbi:MAG TPA: hypothetical protein ENN42_02610 [Thioalkalivibrio sp.]|nr:hypothetical protein [Thioalkalivibrio sp.]
MMHRFRKPLCWALIVALVWLLPPMAGFAAVDLAGGTNDAVDADPHASHHGHLAADPALASAADHACCDDAVETVTACPCSADGCAGCSMTCHLFVSLPGPLPGIDAPATGERVPARPVSAFDFHPRVLLEPPRT